MARPSVLVALIVALLAALTALQYRWIGELSQYQREHMERTVRASTDRFAHDLEDELEGLWYVFSVRGSRRSAGEQIAEDYEEWIESNGLPTMIAEAYWIRLSSDLRSGRIRPEEIRSGEIEAEEASNIERVHLEDGDFEPTDWPAELTVLRPVLLASAAAHRRRGFHESDSFTTTLDDGTIAFIVAQTRLDTKSWAVALLRREMFTDELIGGLVQHHFGPDENREYDVRLIDTEQADRPLFASGQALGAAESSTAPAAADADTAPGSTRPGSLPAAIASADYVRRMEDYGGTFLDDGDRDDRTLIVAATHRAGSVDTAVAQLRRRNLAFSFGVMLVLGASVGILGVAARRSRRLARRQMEFVAGVSHELRTPIAGISSLSQNLADGVVKDIEHAARYGETIYKESRRLGNMVEGVLQFSAIRSGRYSYATHEVDLVAVIDEAVETLDPRQLARTRLTTDIEANLPPVLGDERALRSLVRNLASNALKFSQFSQFSQDGGDARIVARSMRRRGGDEIELRVEDSGPGIDAAEQAQIFKPFFRGKAAQEQQIEGSGLGLSLVKDIVDAHSGRIEVASEPGRGSAFRVYLPVAAAAREPQTAQTAGTAQGSRRDGMQEDSTQRPPDGLQPAGGGGEAT